VSTNNGRVVVRALGKPLALGVDLGGTKVNVGLVDAYGCLLCSRKSFVHPSKQPEKVIDTILDGVDFCQRKVGTEAEVFGIGVAAQLDNSGVVIGSPNLGWQNLPFKKMLEQKLDLPVFVTNDVRAATWGEWRYGSGQGVDVLAAVFVGTGVGGGVISHGNLLSGCNNIAGELGHITLIFDGNKCRCPNRGCLEAYAGGWAIAERAQQAIRDSPKEGQLLVSLAGSIENVSAEHVGAAFHEDDLLAKRLVEKTGRYLAAGVVSVVNAFNPCMVVLGGGVVEGIPELIQTVRDIVPSMALKAAVDGLQIVKAKLGGEAAVVGAASLSQKMVTDTL
jgi:glucokinase